MGIILVLVDRLMDNAAQRAGSGMFSFCYNQTLTDISVAVRQLIIASAPIVKRATEDAILL